MSKPQIVFFGNEKLATGIPEAQPVIQQALESAGYEIEVVLTGGKELGAHKSQVAVLAAHGQILPQSMLDEFPLGIINIHPSLLPIYRGPTPIEQAILDGATKTGVSIMRISSEMDAGPIYKQKSLQLTGNESKAELASTLQQLGAELLLEVLPGIVDGSLKPRQQSHPDRATYTGLLKKSDGQIDWSKPADRLDREIRAYLGWPGSRTMLFDKEVIITAAHPTPSSVILNAVEGSISGSHTNKYKPGDVIATKSGMLAVIAGKNALVIDRLKPAGKKEMAATEFVRGHHRA